MIDARTWNEKVLDSQGNIYFCKADCYVGIMQELSSLITTLKDDVRKSRITYEEVYDRLDDICDTFEMADGDKLTCGKDK